VVNGARRYNIEPARVTTFKIQRPKTGDLLPPRQFGESDKSKDLAKRLSKQGCQMVYFETKNYNLGKFWRILQWKTFVYVMANGHYVDQF
jgi:hypothetical protein